MVDSLRARGSKYRGDNSVSLATLFRAYQLFWATATEVFTVVELSARLVGLCGMTLRVMASGPLKRSGVFAKYKCAAAPIPSKA